MPGRIRAISESQDLRALAHPLRLKLLGALRLDGPATASHLARRFGASSGLTSYHLRALAERGFVEDDPDHAGRGRERWWRAADDAHQWVAPVGSADEPEQAGRVEATRALNREVARIYGQWLEAWALAEPDLDDAWRRVVTSFDRWLQLSPERLGALVAEIEAVLDRYEAEAESRTDGATERIGVVFAANRSEGVLP
ncbi:MAG TPA: helix-turn-helix domain-containing protein [Solirubrobacteraceae bacterium]|jgi:DNA-binding transcriptional ArsR family regulator|nr:helix-turn-helix domain-containing protein [Solirubrobacteraceae bacterium]